MVLKQIADNNFGFTLIELLVVISIIGLLASVVLVSLNATRVKARDAKRSAEIKQLATALNLYLSDNGVLPSNAACTTPVGNPGWCCLGIGDAGTCWGAGNGYHGSTVLDNSLSPKYMSKIPLDPLHNTATYGDVYMYRTDVDANGTYATLHWGIEKANPTAQDCNNGTVGNWGAGAGNGGNGWCMVIVR